MKTSIILSVFLGITLISQSAPWSSFGMDPESYPKKLNESFQLHPHEPTIISNGPEISILDIEDSRCPSDVTCVWQGEVKISIFVSKDNTPLGNFTLTSRAGDKKMTTQTVDGYSIQVIGVNPYPVSTKQIPLEDYVITLIISKKATASPLAQIRSGIASNDIKCREGLQLVFKVKNGYPICVKPETAAKLFKLGLIVYSSKVPESFMPCQTPYPKVDTGIAVLYMPMNSIGKICVRYSNPNEDPVPIGIRIFEANNLLKNATEITTWASANAIPKGDATVVYTIKTGNQSGFYGATIFCVGMPLAVGYDSDSRIVSADFSWLGETFYCPSRTYNFQIDSLSGIGVKHIPFP